MFAPPDSTHRPGCTPRRGVHGSTLDQGRPFGDRAAPGRRTSSRWAFLIARIYDVLPLVCPSCGASMSIIAFVTDPVPVRSILSYLDLPTRPPPLSPARAPRAPREAWSGTFAFDQTSGFDPAEPEPVPDFDFDQSLPD